MHISTDTHHSVTPRAAAVVASLHVRGFTIYATCSGTGGALRCRKAILALPLSATPQRLLWENWTQRWQHFFPLRLISWQRRPHHLPRQLLLLHVHSLPSQHPSRLRQLEEVAKRLRSDLIERTSMYSVANRYAKHNKYKIYTSKRKNINQV